MMSFSTTNRHGYCVRFSPGNPDLLVVASSQYYGLCGAGTLHLLEITDDGLLEIGNVQWGDGLFDAVWAGGNPDQGIVATASGDGTIQLWSMRSLETGLPLAAFPAHSAEIYSVDWSHALCGGKILSSSWDRTAKFVAADGSIVLWDTATPKAARTRQSAHDGEVLTCAWSKFNAHLLATGASDGLIRGWDLRNMSQSVFELFGCEYAVRRVQFSPHDESALVSAAYDFSTRLWDYRQKAEPMETIVHHSEFVYGVDWNPNRYNQIADCGWDSLVQVFKPSIAEVL